MKIYIAGPISNGGKIRDSKMQELFVEDAIQAGIALLVMGHAPFIPHLNFYFEQKIKSWGFKLTHEDYLKWDFEWVKQSDALLRLPGTSNGSDQEVQLAKELGIPVYYSLEEVPDAV